MKIKTNLYTGACYGNWVNGIVDHVEGNGFYAAVRTENDDLRYVNYAYTEFFPNSQALWNGELVSFTYIPQRWPNAGKIGCIQPVPSE